MTRSLSSLTSRTFDVLIVGAGVYGAALGLLVSEAGFSVAIIDRADFAGGTSSNSLKILHGGLRYLQSFDVPRMRSSIRARREWAQLIPEFVAPLPCAIATRGLGLRSAGALGTALFINEVVSLDRNRGIDSACRLPAARLLSSAAYASLTEGLGVATGSRGALWWDAIALDTERMVLELLGRAADKGAVVANYVEATRLLTTASRVRGVTALDRESGSEVEILARRVVCATGALSTEFEQPPPSKSSQCYALNLIVSRDMPSQTALAIAPPDMQGGVMGDLFLVPWKGKTMIGTYYVIDDGSAAVEQQRKGAVQFLSLANHALPRWQLTQADICFVHWGKLPLDPSWQRGEPVRLDSRLRLLDGADKGIAGLWSVSGPKFTTALVAARQALQKVTQNMQPDASVRSDVADQSGWLRRMDHESELSAKAEIAARHLHARHLDDAVLRRTGVGNDGYPGDAALDACARGMGRALNWSDADRQHEIESLQQHYRDWHFWQN